MQLKGMEKIREKMPDYPGRKIALIPLVGFVVAILGYSFLIIMDIIPRVFSDILFLTSIEPYIPFLGSVFIAALGLWLIGRLWNQKEKMKDEYGDLAYQRMIPYGVTGIFLIPTLLFHGFTSIRSLPPVAPINQLTTLWSQSLLPFIGITTGVDLFLRLGLCAFFFVIGALTVRSALFTFGLDYMIVLYLYFPEESEVQENEIYSVVRHPTYLGGVLIGVAVLFFRFSVYSIVLFFIFYLVFRLQARREEKELVERFGESYSAYMSKIPAFYVSPKNFRKFFKFLTGK